MPGRQHPTRSRFALLGVLVLVVGLVASCSSEEQSDALHVVATTSILGDVAANVIGERGTVDVLIPVGVDPHSFAPSSEDVARLNEADLVIANGLGLEEDLEGILDEAREAGVNVLVIGPGVDPLPFGDHIGSREEGAVDEDHGENADHDEEADHDHEEADHEDADADHDDHDHEGSDDPHVWLDPLRMADAAVLIAEALAEIDTATDWTAAAETYADELVQLDGEIEEVLDDIPGEKRLLVTNHDSLGYFADRYEFEIVGTVIPGGSTLGDPSSADLAELVETMRAKSIAVVFADTTNPTRLAEVLTEELGGGVAVVELYTGSLGPEGSGAETLIEMLRTNARLIADALSGG